MKKTVAKINKTKSWLFEKINKIDKQENRLAVYKRPTSSRKKKKTQINRIGYEKEVTTYSAEKQRLMRDYCKQL